MKSEAKEIQTQYQKKKKLWSKRIRLMKKKKKKKDGEVFWPSHP